MSYEDTPKIWYEDTGEVVEYDNTSQLAPVEEVIPLPTIPEQKNMLENSDLTVEDKGILGGLIEINNIANMLDKVRMSETAEARQRVINVYAESFISAHIKNNIRAEMLKDKLLKRLSDNIDNLDLELASRIFLDLQQTMAPDVAIMNARSQGDTGMGAASAINGGPSINLTVNNATTDGASITNNTLAVNQGNPGQLKDITSLNYVIKDMQKVQMPRQPSITINSGN